MASFCGLGEMRPGSERVIKLDAMRDSSGLCMDYW